MDIIKDSKGKDEKDAVVPFFKDKVIRTDPFGHNLLAKRLYGKAEKVTAAIHLVTRHIPEQEPVRKEARKSALDLLSLILQSRTSLRAHETVEVLETRALIRRLISLTGILAVNGNLSVANSETLTDALEDLGTVLDASQKTMLSESFVLRREDFIDAKRFDAGESKIRKGHSRPRLKDDPNVLDQSSSRVDKTQRSEHILQILDSSKTSGEKMGVREVAARLPEYSEKMIQRELKELVVLGRVRKNGSKRWSTYELA